MQGRSGARKRNRFNVAGRQNTKEIPAKSPTIDVNVGTSDDEDVLNEPISVVPHTKVSKPVEYSEEESDNDVIQYSSVFKAPKPKILNLEDIDGDEDQDVSLNSGDNKPVEDNLTERDYLKALDQSDKDDLKEIYEKTGGKVVDARELKDFDNLGSLSDQFSDNRLALSAAEKRMEERNRQIEIETALTDQYETIEDWEKKLLDQQLGKKEVKDAVHQPVLANIEDITTWFDYKSGLKKSKMVLTVQLSRLQKEKHKLEAELEEMINSLR